ncbi:hypothetical protein D3C81_1834480 [compost metagenome]
MFGLFFVKKMYIFAMINSGKQSEYRDKTLDEWGLASWKHRDQRDQKDQQNQHKRLLNGKQENCC